MGIPAPTCSKAASPSQWIPCSLVLEGGPLVSLTKGPPYPGASQGSGVGRAIAAWRTVHTEGESSANLLGVGRLGWCSPFLDAMSKLEGTKKDND